MSIEIYHGAWNPFTGCIDPESHSKRRLDFGVAMYFTYSYASACEYTRGDGYVLTKSVDDKLDVSNIGTYRFHGFPVRNFGDYATVIQNEDNVLEFMREIVAHRMPEMGFPTSEAAIYIGPRADNITNDVIDDYIQTYDDYWNDDIILTLFKKLKCDRYDAQLAFNQWACSYFLEVIDDEWSMA